MLLVFKRQSLLIIIIISIQPEGRFWQEPEPSQATGMALAHCILGSFLGVGCHCFPPPLDVPTFASTCKRHERPLSAKDGITGEKWSVNLWHQLWNVKTTRHTIAVQQLLVI